MKLNLTKTTVFTVIIAILSLCGCNSDSPPSPSSSSSSSVFGGFGKEGEARRYFVTDFWKKRFSKCADGWHKARIDTKEYYIRLYGPATGWLAIKGDPQDWKFDVITPTEADKLRGITWYAEIAMAATVSIAFVDGYESGGRWQKYHDGWTALPLAAMAKESALVGDQLESQLSGEYKQIFLQVYYNEKADPKWNVQTANGRYSDMDADAVRSWLIHGAKPANCNEFPPMP